MCDQIGRTLEPCITTKSVSVFATRFSPDLEPDPLASYLKEKLGRDVTCEKINTVQTRFSSFKITAVCREVGEMYEPQLWLVLRILST